ncbi:TIGR03756 family integrating conjugative element protein [Salinicola peritrichatus]|uniref:TIGR03756 family integrating conjugative element protein n=1 Tax=Salinicola peritrichatus TaxID=1267424 RepID=UPI001EF8A899|nr:TIGR03756 family integrating conjugative element protein [Salinicola peritrichatus]
MIQRLQRVLTGGMLALALALAGAVAAPPAKAITTPEIAASALSFDCLEYEVIGICAWLNCGIWGCTVVTSIRVKNYVPELVVSSYENTGENPWTEMSYLSPPVGDALGGGRTTEEATTRHSNTHFKNVDVVGHPGNPGFYSYFQGSPYDLGFMCSGEAVSFNPYFISTLDALAWRSGVPESAYPEALTPGMREMGAPGDLWSPIYPRSGFVSQYHDYKVAASTAQRAADILTREGQPHVYQPLTPHDSPQSGFWVPDPVMEGDDNTHKWQRLEPNLTMSCSLFPDGGQDNDLREPGDYVWALWRPYRCCQRRGQELLWFTGE